MVALTANAGSHHSELVAEPGLKALERKGDDGRYEVARLLSNYEGKGYLIATTEAGLLPLYSKWDAIDTWGLNDEWIAHHGEATSQYLEQYKPHVIVFHAYFSPLIAPRLIEKNLSQDWFRMTITLKDYAESHGYVLAAAFGDSPYETHYYYVRRDFADSERIVRALAGDKNYYWYATGRKAFNYAVDKKAIVQGVFLGQADSTSRSNCFDGSCSGERGLVLLRRGFWLGK